jgi:triacylglycerol lipase
MRFSVIVLLLFVACAEPPPEQLPVLEYDAGPRPAGATDAATPDAGADLDAGASPDAGERDAGATADAGLTSDGGVPVDGIVFVHGINGSSADWSVMVGRFADAGWPADRLVANSFRDARLGCNTDNATQVSGWVQTLKQRGARRIAIIAHSMGGLSSRYFVKSLSGTTDVSVYVSLGTMHHGLSTPCLNPLPVCVWKELCESGPFIAALNAAPPTPGPTVWFSYFSDGDTTVPMASSQLTGATNLLIPGLQHDGPMGLQNSEVVFSRVVEALR